MADKYCYTPTSDSDDDSDDEFDSCWSITEPQLERTRRVTFDTNPPVLIDILNADLWRSAYIEARVGPFANIMRFKQTIININNSIGWIFNIIHREKIKRQLGLCLETNAVFD